MATKRLGVDIGATHIRLAEVEINGKGDGAAASLTAFGAAPLPPGAVVAGEVIEVSTVSSVLKQLIGTSGCTTKEVTIGIGAPNVVVRELDLPAMPMAQLRTSLPFQVQELLPMSTSEAMLDFYPTSELAGDSGSLLRGVMVAAPKSVVAQNVIAVENAGLLPKLVDLGAFALLRSQLTSETSGKIAAFVDIGARITTVVVAHHGVPRMVRILPSGGQDMTDVVAAALHVGQSEAEQFKQANGLVSGGAPEAQAAQEALIGSARSLVESIRNTFVFYASNNPGAPLEHVVITGGGALMSGLGQYLASASRVPVSFGNAFARVTPSKKLKGDAMQGNEVRGSMAIGLAFGEAS